MNAVIIGNGNISSYPRLKKFVEGAQFIICVDGGARHMINFGIQPHLLVGDLDSISDDDLEFFRSKGVAIKEYPREKDMTDTEIAVRMAVEKGCSDITMVGMLGTRADHSLSNIFLLKLLVDMGVKGRIVDEHNEIMATCGCMEMKREDDLRITLLPLTEKVEGVTTEGLRYPLDNATIEMGSSWGVSNEFAADMARVVVKKGILLVIKSRE